MSDDIEKLKAKNAELLAEKRAIREERDSLAVKLNELQAASEAAANRVSESEADWAKKLEDANNKIADYELNYPVNNFLKTVAVEDEKTMRHILGEKYKFGLVDGEPAVTDLDGTPVKIKDRAGKEKNAGLSMVDFEAVLSQSPDQEHSGRLGRFMRLSGASGSGGSGSARTAASEAPGKAQRTPQVPTRPFGLR